MSRNIDIPSMWMLFLPGAYLGLVGSLGKSGGSSLRVSVIFLLPFVWVGDVLLRVWLGTGSFRCGMGL